MARGEAHIRTSIWKDDDWLALPFEAQWLYEAILSQPDLSWCGVLTWAPGRFARFARGLSKTKVEAARKALVKARFVVVDDDTDELWVRRFVKWEKVVDKPNILVSASHDLAKVHSQLIREGLAEQFRDGLPNGLAGRFEAPILKRFHAGLRELFGEPPPKPSQEPPNDLGPRSKVHYPSPPSSPGGTSGRQAVEDDETTTQDHPPTPADVARLVAERRLAKQRPGTVRSPSGWRKAVEHDVLAESGELIEAALATGEPPEAIAAALEPDAPTGDGVERRACCGTSTATGHRIGCEEGSRPAWVEDDDGAVRAVAR